MYVYVCVYVAHQCYEIATDFTDQFYSYQW